jgi:hypothetical protein
MAQGIDIESMIAETLQQSKRTIDLAVPEAAGQATR